RAMLAGAVSAFVRGDAQLGREICRLDGAVDALRNSVFRVRLTHMMEGPRSIGPGMQLFLVSRNLERVADLATNIAEDVVFLVEGKDDQASRGRVTCRCSISSRLANSLISTSPATKPPTWAQNATPPCACHSGPTVPIRARSRNP